MVQQIIGSLLYDTDKSLFVCGLRQTLFKIKFGYLWQIYKTKNGRYFQIRHENPNKIIPLSKSDAERAWKSSNVYIMEYKTAFDYEKIEEA